MKPREIDRLISVMERLRDPERGCPWDATQTYETIAPHTIEEAYEVAEAIENKDMVALKDELGDLLFQVIYYTQFGKEDGLFDFEAVAGASADKMIRRHPHVFENDPNEVGLAKWEDRKEIERAEKAGDAVPSALDGVTVGLPALTRAVKLQRRAGRVGFDWTEPRDVLDKIVEEAGELRTEMNAGSGKERFADELGDLLFALVNLARKLEIDPEAALRGTNRKFERRFRAVEAALAERGREPRRATLDEMEDLWRAVKETEKS